MKLYKLSFGDYECEHNAGIFSTRELAVEAGDKIQNMLNKLNDMYKVRSFDDLPKNYQDIVLDVISKETASQEDIDDFIKNTDVRRNITIEDTEEHQSLHKKFGNSFFYDSILPNYTIEEYTLDTVVEGLL